MVKILFLGYCIILEFSFDGHLLVHLNIGNAGVIRALAGHQNKI